MTGSENIQAGELTEVLGARGGAPRRAPTRWSLPTPALCIFSIWLFLSYILYNKLIIVSKLFFLSSVSF